MRPAPTAWADEVSLPLWPNLERDASCEVLVIGAGLAGLAVAGELARRGVDAMVVDAEAPGAGASTRNAGFVLVCHPWMYPEQRLRLGVEGARTLIGLARRTRAILEQGFDEDIGYRRSGSLMLANAEDPAELAALERIAAVLTEDGVPVERTEAPQGTAGFGPALLIPEDGEVHPGRLVAALARRVPRAAIARIEELHTVTRIARAGTLVIRFERAVVATNAWSRCLLPELDQVIVPQRAQVLLTEPLASRHLDRPCYATYGYDYFRQRTDGSLIVGGQRHRHLDDECTDLAMVTPPVQQDLERFVQRHLPFAAQARVARRWAGIMGFTPDQAPIVGPWPHAPETILVLGGWSGHGVGLALGCAERLAQFLNGDRNAIPAVLDPARFPTERSSSSIALKKTR
jgi:glycine/D-amino acid oxidase-like deaminating enzyme